MYDVIIVGAGLGGLSAGLNLAVNHKKVLILEKNTLPGGMATTIKKGRFEFDPSVTDFYGVGTLEKPGIIRRTLNDYGVLVDSEVVPFDSLVFSNGKEEFIMHGDIDEFFVELEKIKNGSLDSLREFLRVIKEIHDALDELQNDDIDLDNYPYFTKYLNYNVLDALGDLKMPKETINRLGFLWVYLGSPLDKLSFIDFADFMYKLVFKKLNVLKKKNLDFILQMVNRYQELNGKIFYRSLVTEVNDEGSVKIVKTSDGKEYKTRNVIFDVAKRYVYQNLITEPPKEVNRLENARSISPMGFVVCLGLNKDYKTLGFKHYHYYHFDTMDSVKNARSMMNLFHATWDATIPNVVNEFASPKNTSILILKTTYFGDAFTKTSANKQEVEEKVAEDLINQFEKTTGIDIQEYIEEIEIISPYELYSYTNSPNGSIMGMARKSYDNAIHRIISYEDEEIPNYYFVGGNAIFGGGVHNAIYSGKVITDKLLENMEENNGE